MISHQTHLVTPPPQKTREKEDIITNVVIHIIKVLVIVKGEGMTVTVIKYNVCSSFIPCYCSNIFIIIYFKNWQEVHTECVNLIVLTDRLLDNQWKMMVIV